MCRKQEIRPTERESVSRIQHTGELRGNRNPNPLTKSLLFRNRHQMRGLEMLHWRLA